MLLPGALTVYLAFNAGGFFPGTPALVAVVLALLVTARLAVARNPFEGLSPLLGVAIAAIALYAVWTLASAFWSDAPARALIEFDRALLYLLALLFFGSLRRQRSSLRVLAWGMAGAAFGVSAIALFTRLFPDLWSVDLTIESERLSFPLTYWNALGVLAALGLVLCLAFTTRDRESPAGRIVGAAAIPVLAATLALTFSRGAILFAAGAALIYVLISGQRALLTGLPVAAVAAAAALVPTYGADLLATVDPTTPEAAAQGHNLAIVLLVATLGAALLRAVLVLVDRRLRHARLLSGGARRVLGGAGAASVAVAALTTVVALDASGFIGRQYDRLISTPSPGDPDVVQSRLTDPAAGSRIDNWEVAVGSFENAPLAGEGAGTYELSWAQERPTPNKVEDAHSLYVEVLGELGIVGLALLATALLVILFGFARRVRGRNRALHSVLLAAAIAWLGHAGIDWDWEMPAVTLWFFCAGGAVLATSDRRSRHPRLRPAIRLTATLGLLAVAATPALMALSQFHLSKAEDAATGGDCGQAVDSALASISVLGVRPEPYETLGYCDLRLNAPALAAPAFERAVDRDPDNWRYRYGLAIARAANARDPRGSAHAALRLNPLNTQAQELVRLFGTDDPEKWRRRAETARPALN